MARTGPTEAEGSTCHGTKGEGGGQVFVWFFTGFPVGFLVVEHVDRLRMVVRS